MAGRIFLVGLEVTDSFGGRAGGVPLEQQGTYPDQLATRFEDKLLAFGVTLTLKLLQLQMK